MNKCLILLLLCFVSISANANKYVSHNVNSISVNGSGKNTIDAKSNAVNYAQEYGLKKILSRRGIDERMIEWISKEDISKTVQSMQFKNEIITKKTYAAKIDLTFSIKYLDFILNKYKIFPNSNTRKSYLILPFEYDEDSKDILLSNNKWREAIEEESFIKDIDAIDVVTNEDYANYSITKNKIFNASFYSFENLINKYQKDIIVLTNAYYDKSEDTYFVNLTIISKNKNEKMKLSYFNSNGLSKRKLKSDAARRLLDYIVENESTSNDGSMIKKEIEINVPIKDLKDYVDIDRALNKIDFIKKLETISFNRDIVKYKISYEIDNNLVIGEFEKNGFYIKKNGNKYYLFGNQTFKLMKNKYE